MQSRFKN